MKILVSYLWVALGGSLGAMMRFAVARLSASLFGISFPYGTFIINITGSFLLGIVATLVSQRLIPNADNVRLVVAIGFLGAYTTFSTFEFESHSLFDDGNWIYGLANLFASLFVGLLAIRFGILLARRWV